MKLLEQHCLLCSAIGARYVKTKGGLYKVCGSCEKVLSDAGLLIPPEIVYPMSETERA